jgi:hypothetical protein
MTNNIKYGTDRRREWQGICRHGINFRDTFTGCQTNCKKCLIHGKIIGYNKDKLTPIPEERITI